MIFHEVYGCYYNTVAKLIALAVEGKLNDKEMNKVVAETAFDESILSIVPSIKNQEWQLIDKEFGTPICEAPSMPLTLLEKRWFKTILSDPRTALFQDDMGDVWEQLKDVEPLFDLNDVVYFDQYMDGDHYDSPHYVTHFKTVLRAIREHRKIAVQFWTNRNKLRDAVVSPLKLEYLNREDRFRILTTDSKGPGTINMNRVMKCHLLDEKYDEQAGLPERTMETLVFELTNERNALERTMMKFAHLKKQVERIDETTYRVELEYDKEDETDVVIQIMSFGSFVRVLGPKSLKRELRKRIRKQMDLIEWE